MDLHVLLSSGGTTSPIDPVRFIDNFSTGKRGSLSAEVFLLNDYHVYFLYRKGSLLPFIGKHNLLDLNIEEYIKDKKLFDYYKERERLILIPFTTVNEYLNLLENLVQKLGKYDKRALLYLAAAVSDFQLSMNAQAPLSSFSFTDKIQSKSMLTLELEQVPKNLYRLFHEFAPNAFSITFKLETNPQLLKSKALESLNTYKHDLVIGNLLETRYKNVILYSIKDKESELMIESPNLEQKLIEKVISLHNQYIHK